MSAKPHWLAWVGYVIWRWTVAPCGVRLPSKIRRELLKGGVADNNSLVESR